MAMCKIHLFSSFQSRPRRYILSPNATDMEGPIVCQERLSASASYAKGRCKGNVTKGRYVVSWDGNRLVRGFGLAAGPTYQLKPRKPKALTWEWHSTCSALHLLKLETSILYIFPVFVTHVPAWNHSSKTCSRGLCSSIIAGTFGSPAQTKTHSAFSFFQFLFFFFSPTFLARGGRGVLLWTLQLHFELSHRFSRG